MSAIWWKQQVALLVGRTGLRRGYVSYVQQRGHRRNHLRSRKWLLQQSAVRHPFCCPISGAVTGHVYDGKLAKRMPSVAGDFPSVASRTELDVRYDPE